jgi:hypothetical protein
MWKDRQNEAGKGGHRGGAADAAHLLLARHDVHNGLGVQLHEPRDDLPGAGGDQRHRCGDAGGLVLGLQGACLRLMAGVDVGRGAPGCLLQEV